MAANETLFVFDALSNEPPTSNYAQIDTRNAQAVLDFDASANESALFSGVVPSHFTANASIEVKLHFAMSSATSGNVVWDVAVEKGGSGQNMDNDGFASTKSVTAAVSGTSGELVVGTVLLTNAEADGLASGESVRFKITRDASNGSDSATGDAELRYVEIREV